MIGKDHLREFSFNLSSTTEENQNEISYSIYSNFKVQGGLWMVGYLVLFEYLLLLIKKKPVPAVHENVISMTHAVFHEIGRLFIRAMEFNAYSWVWENYAIFPHIFSDSISTFVLSTLLIDLCFYWFHRASHEIMLFWSIHQVHHISEEFTVSVGLRHYPIQNLFSWTFYLPLAVLGLPSSLMLIHLQLSLLYQTWIHTCTISNLGPFEWVFNTPSHHRVHHGSIPYCIDKNYGGIFIIWDYIFRTFEKERSNEKIVYGLVMTLESWNPLKHQIGYMEKMHLKAKSMTTWKDYFDTFWKGPSWFPGLSRLGREVATPDTRNKELLKANTSLFINCYIILHLVGTMYLTTVLTSQKGFYNFLDIFYGLFILVTISNIGSIYDGQSAAWTYELARSILGMIIFLIFPLEKACIPVFMTVLYLTSACLWISPFKKNIPLEDISIYKKEN